eukprot:TRINITY_DN10324_c0_g1_i1.p2 TRINITY_DN10324_c0_g1~~TRINITY_DN10324_c0_g1_i1.p2  ORF type:complete len:376 (-),score=46.49 TRINITY_DN10324_c0_g1_i1:255-1298(-)
MGLTDLIPSSIYSLAKPAGDAAMTAPAAQKPVALPSASEKKQIEMYSTEFYTACGIGGWLSCGLTHMAVTPLDVVKCNMQIDSKKYKSIGQGFSVVIKESGVAGLFRGWAPTLVGYGFQGTCKFGFYEYFKKTYADMAGAEAALKYQTPLFLVASASAEVIADVALCPWEAVKVKVQTVPGYAKGLMDGLPKVAAEGELFKPLVPLWGRQIPYTMMKFAAFENIVNMLYANVVPKPKAECSKTEQLGVSFAAGYIAGVLCALVSQPADNMVSKLSSNPSATIGSVVEEFGIAGLFLRGLPLRILMVGTLTGLQWGIYDAYKAYAGLPTSGGGIKKEMIDDKPEEKKA